MLNILKQHVYGIMSINSCYVVGNSLIISSHVGSTTIVNGYNKFKISTDLIVIDMNKRIMIINYPTNFNPLSSIDDSVYIYKRDDLIMNKIKIEYSQPYGYSLNFPKDLEVWQAIMDNDFVNNRVTTIIGVFKLKNDIYYCANLAGDNEGVIYNKFIFRRFEDNSELLTVNLLMLNVSVIKSDSKFVVNLPFKNCKILHDTDTLIFFDRISQYVRVNLNTGIFKIVNIEGLSPNVKNIEDYEHFKTITVEDMSGDKHDVMIISDYEILYQYGSKPDPIENIENGSYVSDVDNRRKIIYNLLDDTHEIFNFDKYVVAMNIFIYNGKKHYIIVDINFNFNIYVNENDYFKSIHNPPAIFEKDSVITIGTKDENVKISLYLLINKSYFINSLREVLKGNNEDVLISNNLKNIIVYKEFVEERKYNIKNLYDLYVIANYMQDYNINYLAEIIVLYVKQMNIDINEAFRYLELLHSSTCDEQLIALIYVVYKKIR